uniref:UDP-N-acetylglucosamine--dolichyl-phosphate N-acetylglucosaminephosphotransferase n=1 Tax=Trichogramma kaykai TaxID=54128 RepID=A0ABD2WUK3_9HYME
MDQLPFQSLPLCGILAMSICTYFATLSLIPVLREKFIKANLFGIDMNKKTHKKIPEAMGIISGGTFLITMFLFIPVRFSYYIFNDVNLPRNELDELLAALLSICCMLLFGFLDDVLNLKWRHKLFLPTISSLPLLIVYYINSNSTLIIVPKPFRTFFGLTIDLGIFYYFYMLMLAVFCTNAINIHAGINGLEAGQSIVIAISIIIFNGVELFGKCMQAHQFSLYLMIPFLASSVALFKYNRYPASVFVGDTFCYSSGMTFVVVGIIGHFSKTMLLFFMPQIFNFLYSVPQLFHLIPCPRHRLPKYDEKKNISKPSVIVFDKKELNRLARFIMSIFRCFRVVDWKESDDGIVVCNNLTLNNFVLIFFGPIREPSLTNIMLLIQTICSVFAFIIRYPLASIFYDT